LPRPVIPGREQIQALTRGARHPLWWLPDPAAQQDEAYRRVWQNLRTLECVEDGRHDEERWRDQPGDFAMCCVRAPSSCFTSGLGDLRAALESFPFVRLHPDSSLHIPILELGIVRDEPSERDEISRNRLGEFITQAQRPLVDFPRFPVFLGPVNSFADAVFLDVHDGGWLSRIHRRLIDFGPVPPSTRFPYLPHLTLGHYDRAAPIGNLPAVLAEWRDLPIGEFLIEHVDVVTVDTNAAFPPFQVVHEFALGTTRATGTFPTRPDPLGD